MVFNNEIVALLLTIGHIVAAGLVTIHVLLTNRSVRASIGWIGLAYLSPFVGSAIYAAFGVNRTARRGARLRSEISHKDIVLQSQAVLDEGLPANILKLEKANARIAGTPVIGGNTFKLYQDGTEAYPAMLEAIRNARSTIVLASYIFAGDETGRQFARALQDAKERGVEVRVLIDGIGSGYFWSPIFRRLERAGVKTGRFLHEWLPWQMPFINLRNHKKILIVDGVLGFTGGMNISDDNVDARGPIKVRDVHARIEGPIVRQLMQTFERDWQFTNRQPLSGEEWWPEIEGIGTVEMRGINSGPDEHVGNIASIWAQAIESAEKCIRIVTPYFLPEDWLLELLNRAADRDVEIELIVPKRTNHFYFNWAMRAHLQGLRLDRIKCMLSAGPFDHSKLMSVDGHWSSFGSPNWDARSMRLNFEFLLECYDAEATAEIDRVIDAKMANSTRLTWEMLRDRPWWQKLRDASFRLLLPYL